jgi:hypothetical protein
VDAERTGSSRAWSWLLLLVGGVNGGGVSVTVNIAHAYVRPVGAGKE